MIDPSRRSLMKATAILGMSTVLSLPGAFNPVSAAGYLKLGDIKGESTDSKHDKWIDVLSVDWGTHKPGGGAAAPGGRRFKAAIRGDQVIVKQSGGRRARVLDGHLQLPDGRVLEVKSGRIVRTHRKRPGRVK